MTKLSENSMLITLSISKWGGECIDRDVTSEVHETHRAETGAGRYVKRLIGENAFRGINGIVAHTRNNVFYHYTLPWTDDGSRILPSEVYFEFMDEMSKCKDEFLDEVELFLRRYPVNKRAAEKRLGDMYSEKEYPTDEEIRERFDMSIKIRPMPDEQDFRVNLSDTVIADIRSDISNEMTEVLQSTSINLAVRVAEVLEGYSEGLERYGTKEGGSKRSRTFTSSTIDKLHEIARLIPKLNVSNDERLNDICQRINDCDLDRYDASALKEDDHLRHTKAEDAKEILGDLTEAFGL